MCAEARIRIPKYLEVPGGRLPNLIALYPFYYNENDKPQHASEHLKYRFPLGLLDGRSSLIEMDSPPAPPTGRSGREVVGGLRDSLVAAIGASRRLGLIISFLRPFTAGALPVP
jgi:hypothetical protein